MKTKVLCLLLWILLAPIPTARAGIIFGQLIGTPPEGTVTYVACVNNNWNEILTEDSINPDAGIDQGYQGGYFRLDAANFSSIHAGDLVTVEFSGIDSREGKTASIAVAWNGRVQDQGDILFTGTDTLATPPQPIAKIVRPGVVWLTWKPQEKWLRYHIYRSTQAAGGSNIASNGRYQLLASKFRPPYIDTSVPSAPGIRAWYILIAENRYGRRSGHSEEDYIPDTSLCLQLTAFKGEVIDNAVQLTWQLALPLELQGFNLYRGTKRIGKYLKMNSNLIQSAPGNSLVYSYVDDTVSDTESYFYYIETINLAGKAIRTLPIEVSLLK